MRVIPKFVPVSTIFVLRTSEREVGGSIHTRVAVLYPWARYIYLPKSTGNTQEAVALSRHDWKIVDWDVKLQPKQTKQVQILVLPAWFYSIVCRNNLTSIGVQPLSRRGIDIEYSTLCDASGHRQKKYYT